MEYCRRKGRLMVSFTKILTRTTGGLLTCLENVRTEEIRKKKRRKRRDLGFFGCFFVFAFTPASIRAEVSSDNKVVLPDVQFPCHEAVWALLQVKAPVALAFHDALLFPKCFSRGCFLRSFKSLN